MKSARWLLVLGSLLFAPIEDSRADCASPLGVAGQLEWFASQSAIRYCDGSQWQRTYALLGLACSASEAGQVNYGLGFYAYCSGTAWVNMKGPLLQTTSCAAGTVTFDASLQKLKMCDGLGWYDMTGLTL